jgi:hypothetical protein
MRRDLLLFSFVSVATPCLLTLLGGQIELTDSVATRDCVVYFNVSICK